MTDINWGILQPVDIGGAFQQGFEQGKARRVDAMTGAAIEALLRDPNSASDQIGALARVAPKNALAVAEFQRQQQQHAREAQFREAQGRYLSTFSPGNGAVGVLQPGRGPMVGVDGMGNITGSKVGADGGPPISMAPPPPSNWQDTVGSGALAALGLPTADAPASASPAANIASVDPNSVVDPYAARGIGAESGVTGQHAPGETPMPAEIARAAQSPNMEARNRAFMEMAKIDPLAAMKIDSEMRDQTLNRLEDADKAYRLAIARLPRVSDEASYQAVLNEVDALLAPLGQNVRDTVPPHYPGPDGIRQLLMLALDSQQQLAAMDRRFSAEARVADMQADNARQDRNTDNMIANRDARTGIAQSRAATADRRESRIASGGGKRGGRGSSSAPTAVNPQTGERVVLKGGKWVPVK